MNYFQGRSLLNMNKDELREVISKMGKMLDKQHVQLTTRNQLVLFLVSEFYQYRCTVCEQLQTSDQGVCSNCCRMGTIKKISPSEETSLNTNKMNSLILSSHA